MDYIVHNGSSAPEKLISLNEAAEAVGAKYWQIQRLAKRGRIPVYRPYNSRPLVKLTEVLMFIEASCQGGDE